MPQRSTPSACIWKSPLTPLQASESEELLGPFFFEDSNLVRLREKITENAEGNPLYIEEVLRTLLESKALVRFRRENKWTLNADADSIGIPNTIHDAIAARIDRLPEPLKQVLTVAAVIGRTFDVPLLRAVLSPNDDIDPHIAEAPAAGLQSWERRRGFRSSMRFDTRCFRR